MRAGKPEATTAELSCGGRMTREANATRTKVQGKSRRTAPQPAVYNPVDTGQMVGLERVPTRVR